MIILSARFGSAALGQSGGCSWDDAIGQPGIEQVDSYQANVRQTVDAMTVFDDGSGPAVYAGGYFKSVGGTVVNSIAKWTGSNWEPLGGGVTFSSGNPGVVYAMTSFDDGTGPALYVGGIFFKAGATPVNYIAKWNGTTWSALDSGVSNGSYTSVRALLVHNDNGLGNRLFVGGDFTIAGGQSITGIATWNGSQWTSVGGSVGGAVYAMAIYDDGPGPALYVGGSFGGAGSSSQAHNVAKWNGLNWEALIILATAGTIYGTVNALAVHDAGDGPALYLGGTFTQSDSGASNLVKWQHSHWYGMGFGGSEVTTLASFNDGTHNDLYVGGHIAFTGTASWLQKWNGTMYGFAGVDIGVDGQADVLYVRHDRPTPILLVGGEFMVAGNNLARHVASWNGQTWSALGSGVGGGIGGGVVRAMTTYDDGSGPALYACGGFASMAGGLANHIAKWDGRSWTALATGSGGTSGTGLFAAPTPAGFSLAVFNDGTGPALYVTGSFSTAGGVAANSLARWNGQTWSPVGSGNQSGFSALAVYDDGSGPALYVAGGFTSVDGVPANRVAKWNGTMWSALGTGLTHALDPLGCSASALTVHNDGTGPALYVGGHFDRAGGATAATIARWNGANWSALGSGLAQSGPWPNVQAMASHNDGSGLKLYVAGQFTNAGGQPVSGFAQWNGSSWSAASGGLAGTVMCLESFDDGDGAALYAGGGALTINGSPVNRIAKWDGSNWSGLAEGIGGSMPTGQPYVWSLHGFHDGPNHSLFVGGAFTQAGMQTALGIAEWRCSHFAPGDIDGSGHVNIDDLVQIVTHWGPCGVPCPADVNSDGVVNIDDLVVVVTHWG